jgi:hypothetical protein
MQGENLRKFTKTRARPSRAPHALILPRPKIQYGFVPLGVYCLFVNKLWVVLFTHCHQIYIRKEISRPDFLEVCRYSVVHPIDLRQVFLRDFKNISICKFDDSVSCPGLYPGMVGCVGRIFHANSGIEVSKIT